MVYKHNGKLHSCKNILLFAKTWVDIYCIILSKINLHLMTNASSHSYVVYKEKNNQDRQNSIKNNILNYGNLSVVNVVYWES